MVDPRLRRLLPICSKARGDRRGALLGRPATWETLASFPSFYYTRSRDSLSCTSTPSMRG